MALLTLIRHGQSEYNAKNLECGWIDSPLTELGHQQAKEAGEKVKNTNWDYVFESDLIRSHQTTQEILKVINQSPVVISNPAIKERNYGIYAGKDKSEVSFEVRRGWNSEVPEGENLKMVFARVIPYFESEIFPKLKEGKNVIVCAHGNSLRALVKYLNNISDENIDKLEIPVGTIVSYKFEENKLTPAPLL